MTFRELCLSDPHEGIPRSGKPFALLVQTRSSKDWRFYKASTYEQAEEKAFGSDDCLDVLRIIPISLAQYETGIANIRQHTNYNRRKAKSSLAGR